MTRTHLQIDVELVSGRGEDLWPRPGRSFVVARSMTFQQLAFAIDVAFARWDRAHLHQFDLAGKVLLCGPGRWDDLPQLTDGVVLLSERTKLSRLALGEKFAYTFDLGDDWTHLCTVGPEKVDPWEALGELPAEPVVVWGWGSLPDQYGRGWARDDGESPEPPRPQNALADLPPLMPWWGPQRR